VVQLDQTMMAIQMSQFLALLKNSVSVRGNIGRRPPVLIWKLSRGSEMKTLHSVNLTIFADARGDRNG